MYRTILIDDEILALEGLADLLHFSGQFEIVCMFENPKDVLSKIGSIEFDIAFLDIDMPYINGIDLAEQIIELKPEVEIVFVTAYENFAMSAIKTGAAGYIVKPADVESLHRVVRHISRRVRNAPAASTERPKLIVNGFGRVTYETNQQDLNLVFPTAKSEELFLLLLQQSGKSLTKDEIIDKLWEHFTIDSAMNNFHVNCYYLRQCLNKIGMGGHFKRDRSGYMIMTKDIVYNVWEFDRLQTGSNTLDEALVSERLYKGEFLVDRDYAWAEGLRESYEKKYIGILTLIIKKMSERDDLQRLIYYYRKAIDKDPLNEQYYAGLLNALYLARQYNDIRDLFRRIKKEYNEWLGINPPQSIIDIIKNMKVKN